MNRLLTNDANLLKEGKNKIDWALENMPLLKEITNEFSSTKPFKDKRIGVSMHLEQKTAVLLLTLHAGGAEVVATGNLGTTQNDIALALNDFGITVYGRRENTKNEHIQNLKNVLKHRPNMLLDNGADLLHYLVNENEFSVTDIIGSTEETTSGGHRIIEEMNNQIPFPVIVINDSPLKMIIENKHGVGQSIVENFSRLTNLMIIGKKISVFGYGWCGRGIAKYFKSFGAHVAVVETDAIKALEAAVDGFEIKTSEEAFAWSAIIITATGRPNIIKADHFNKMRDGVILANSGHFDWEIDAEALRTKAISVRKNIASIESFIMPSGKKIILFCDGRMFNLAGHNAKGNTIETMDMGFTLQALSLQWIASGKHLLKPGTQPVPNEVNYETAKRMLSTIR